MPTFSELRQILTEVAISVGFPGILFSWLVGLRIRAGERPHEPDPTEGYMTLIHNRFGDFYVTPFEHFTASYGMLLSVALVLVGVALSPAARRGGTIRMSHPRLCMAVMVLSIVVYVLLWWRLIPRSHGIISG